MRHLAIGGALAGLLCLSSTSFAAHDSTRLYTIDLETGAATEVGEIGTKPELIGLAATTIEGETLLVGVTTSNQLIAFSPETPGSLTVNVPLTGLVPGVDIIGLDVRPATNGLYGFGDDHVLYWIDPVTGATSAVGPAIDPALAGTMAGFDFNPTVDRIRLISNTGQNLRLNPETGAVGTNADTGQPTIDGEIAWAEGDANSGGVAIVGAGYTNSVAGAEETLLYVIDDAKDVLALQDPPNDGTLNTIGALGIDVSQIVGFDITPDGVAYLVANDTAD